MVTGPRSTRQHASMVPGSGYTDRDVVLHLGGLDTKHLAELGEGRQVHVDGEGADGREQAQDQGHLEVAGYKHLRIVPTG